MPAINQPQDDVRNLRIRQTWLEEEAEKIFGQYDLKNKDEAFQSLAISLLFNVDYDAIEPDEIVDGGQDKQIDVIRIDDDPDQGAAHIHIVQAKNVNGFGSTVAIQIRNGLDWIFERPKSEYIKLDNKAFVNKIGEVRDLRLNYTPSNLTISVYFVTLGDATELSDEYLQERKVLVDKYKQLGFAEFNFREVGAFELYELLNENERSKRRINIDIPVLYDINRPSLIEYGVGDTKAVICTMTGEALAQAASVEPRDAIFDLNVRQFYGARGRVNPDIEKTCIGDEADRFWFLNNGVTIICDSYSMVKDPDQTKVRLYNPQIVNGCQTTVTLREAWERKTLKSDVRILVRIYATDNLGLVKRITLTTNNQNRITDRDLRANDDVQDDIQRMMKEKYEYFYERKNNEFRSFSGKQKKRIIPNYKAAQAYLAIVRQKPSVARGYLGKIWSDFYEEIFKNTTVEDLLASYLIYRYSTKQAKSQINRNTPNSELAVYGSFHLARICGFLLTKDEWGPKKRQQIASLIEKMEDNEAVLDNTYQEAFQLLTQIRKETRREQPNPTLYFKANDVQKAINLALHKL